MTLIHHQSRGTVMIDGPNTSLGCHGLDDVLLRTVATARKIKISFVFFKLILSKYGFLSFHSRNMCSWELCGCGSSGGSQDTLLGVLLPWSNDSVPRFQVHF